MTSDLEARVVQAAREAVAQVVRDESGQPSPETIACVLAGRLDHTQAVRFAILGARAALAEIERDSEWQPIETAPKDGTRVLVFSTHYGIGVASWNAMCNEWWIEPSDRLEDPEIALLIHWRPLPKSPYGE